MLLDDSRLSYNEMAQRLDVSINTIRARIKRMLEQGLIKYHTIINLDKFGYTLIYILIKYDEQYRLLDKLSVIGKITMIVKCLGDIFVMGIAIKDHHNPLELVRAFIEPYDATILLSRDPSTVKLSKNSLRIIKYLIEHPRAKNKEIASKLDISTKTVKRILDHLQNNEIIGFSVIMNPSKLERYTNFGMIIKIDDEKVIKEIYDILEDHFLLAPLIYDNAIITVLYGENLQSIDEYYRKIKGLEGVNHVELVIPLSMEFKTNIL